MSNKIITASPSSIRNSNFNKKKPVIDLVDDFETYKKHVNEIARIIQIREVICTEYIASAYKDKTGAFEAVNQWFKGTDYCVDIEPITLGKVEFLDISVIGFDTDLNVKIPSDESSRINSVFNVYYDESTKSSTSWNTDLLTSLSLFCEEEFSTNNTLKSLNGNIELLA